MKSSQNPHTSSQQRQSPQGKVTVEDLLKFKRAEHPPAEFWTGFEEQLKERQLAAAIEVRRPWWHALPRLALALPAGATAAVAIGVIIWQNQDTAQPAPGAATVVTAAAAPAAAPEKTAAVQSEQNADPAAPILALAQQQPAPAPAAKPTDAQIAATLPVASEHLQAARQVFGSEAPAASPAANTRSFSTVTLAGVKPVQSRTTSTTALFAPPITLGEDYPALTIAPLATPGITTETATRTLSVTPLAAADTDTAGAKNDETSDSRRERLLTYIESPSLQNTAVPDNPRVIRMRDRVTSRLNDKALSDSISRIGATGDSLTIKF